MFDDLDMDREGEAEDFALLEKPGLSPPREMSEWLGDPKAERQLLELTAPQP